jgi:hypothetical protein
LDLDLDLRIVPEPLTLKPIVSTQVRVRAGGRAHSRVASCGVVGKSASRLSDLIKSHATVRPGWCTLGLAEIHLPVDMYGWFTEEAAATGGVQSRAAARRDRGRVLSQDNGAHYTNNMHIYIILY